MLFQVATLWSVYIWSIESAVLDPSLFLSPSPPLTDVSGSITPAEMWSRSSDARVSRGPIETLSPYIDIRSLEKRTPDQAAKARLFWPSVRPSRYTIGTGDIQIPLTFSLSGLYGRYSAGSSGTGVIGSTYGTVSEISGTAVSALAGSGYGKYRSNPGIRVYGGENGPAWSGWGNGKWGHYGKG